MSAWLRRTLTFTRFSLSEYARSGRILVELAALVIVLWVLFWPRGTKGIEGDQFFSLGGLFLFALTAFTTWAFMRLGKRPEGYVLLARPLGRIGYLLGLYLAALIVSTAIYVLLSLIVPLLNLLHQQPFPLSPTEWLIGTLPLLLDLAIVAAFTMLLAPLVLSKGQRLIVLGLFALGLSVIFGVLGPLDTRTVLWPLQILLGFLFLPAASGFELAVQRDYSLASLWILLGQAASIAVLLSVAAILFKRRDLIL